VISIFQTTGVAVLMKVVYQKCLGLLFLLIVGKKIATNMDIGANKMKHNKPLTNLISWSRCWSTDIYISKFNTLATSAEYRCCWNNHRIASSSWESCIMTIELWGL